MAIKGRRKKLLPITTPQSDTLRSLRNRLEKDVEIMGKFPMSKKENKLYPIDECVKGVAWLTWLENEKRNEERRLAAEKEYTYADGLGTERASGNETQD